MTAADRDRLSDRVTDEQIAAFDKWFAVCGPCDGGLPMDCAHPSEDYRNPMLALRYLLLGERARADEATARLAALREACADATRDGAGMPFLYTYQVRELIDGPVRAVEVPQLCTFCDLPCGHDGPHKGCNCDDCAVL